MNKRRAIKENEANIRDLKKKVRQLYCEHKHVKFNSGDPFRFYTKDCKVCGKTLEWYDTGFEFYTAQLKYHKDQIEDLEETIKIFTEEQYE